MAGLSDERVLTMKMCHVLVAPLPSLIVVAVQYIENMF